ncbi:MAG: histidine--tRNA ligase [Candidatus Methanolliviera hydrocarbonicum]|uniref:Histidine--tRNA ligase n=1 Tax=Candidatus Methanolliviera hydrocarbonicum TaxID=2491085 RepID=A0A520KVI0_9EURY|nr:MAG: histidine--tRNA ligase [Candidatus Methanolliviera hydrocarbonicum]
MIERPRGTRDFLPEEMRRRRFVERKMRESVERWGYEEIKTPTFEHLDLFTLKSGEDIVDEIYSFEDKGGRKLALRPELTAPVIRFYVNELQNEPKPLRFYYFDDCFRYERPQKGRFREFWQFGIELIGGRRDLANFEMITLSVDILRNIGLGKFDLHVGDVSLLKKAVSSQRDDLDEEKERKIFRLMDKKDEEGLKTYLAEIGIDAENLSFLMNVSGNQRFVSTSDPIEEAKRIFGDIDEIKQLSTLLGLLNAYEIYPKIDLSIARGLDYYTGIVFEIYAEEGLGAQRQICGGGEYDLIELFGGREERSRGFAFGFDRIMEVLKIEKEEENRIMVISTDDCRREGIKVARKLRKKFKVELDVMGRSLKSQLSYANSKGVKKVVIVGKREVEGNFYTLKDMDSGEQISCGEEELLEMIANL